MNAAILAALLAATPTAGQPGSLQSGEATHAKAACKEIADAIHRSGGTSYEVHVKTARAGFDCYDDGKHYEPHTRHDRPAKSTPRR